MRDHQTSYLPQICILLALATLSLLPVASSLFFVPVTFALFGLIILFARANQRRLEATRRARWEELLQNLKADEPNAGPSQPSKTREP